MKAFEDYKPALSEIPARRFWLYIAIMFACAVGNALVGCEKRDTPLNVERANVSHTELCERIATPHGETWVCSHGDWLPPMVKKGADNPEPREGNPDFNVGGGSGGGGDDEEKK